MEGSVIDSASRVITPMTPTFTPAASTRVERLTLGHSTGRPFSRRFAARNGKRAWDARALSAPRRSAPVLEPAGVHRAEVEIVIANRRGGVAERVVRVDDDGALGEIRLDAVEVGVARVEQQHGAAIGSACRAEVLEIATEQGQTPASVDGEDLPVQIRRADEGQRDAPVRIIGSDGCRPDCQNPHHDRRERQRDPAGPERLTEPG